MLMEPATDVAAATGSELELVWIVAGAFDVCAFDTVIASIDNDVMASAER
jgi:hypothetical protein